MLPPLLAGLAAVSTAHADLQYLRFSRVTSFEIPDTENEYAGSALNKLADLNRDGKLDVVSMPQNGRLYIYLGNGDGTFGTPSSPYRYSPMDSAREDIPGYQLTGGLDVGDFNGDGKTDVVAADRPSGRISVFLGNGDGTLADPILAYTAAGGRPADVKMVDIDQDGRLDIFVTTSIDSKLVHFKNINNTLAAPTVLSLPLENPSAMTVLDHNHDGKPDLLTTGKGGLTLLINNNGNLTPKTVTGMMSGPLCHGAVPYGNGKWCMMVAGFKNPSETIVNLVYDTDTASPRVVDTTASYFYRMTVVDMNLDGQKDVLMTTIKGSFLLVPFKPDGNYDRTQTISSNFTGTWDIEAGDLNGDGFPDLIVGDASTNFKAMVQRPPVRITSANSTRFFVGQQGSFNATGTESGLRWTVSGKIPAGVTFNGSGTFSGTPAAGTAGTYPLVLSAENNVSQKETQRFTLTVAPPPRPLVTDPTFNSVSSSAVIAGSTVVNDTGFPLTARGIVYSPTSVNANPTLGGSGVVNRTQAAITGQLSTQIPGLTPGTEYSFAGYASNSHGTSYSPVGTFTTLVAPGNSSLVVTTLTDEDNGNSDPANGTGTSLREAVNFATVRGSSSTITFSPNLFANGPAVINLTQGPIHIAILSGATNFTGPGASKLTIRGNGSSGLFTISQESSGAAFTGITFENGSNPAGGGAINAASFLYATDCVFSGNHAPGGSGGAIYSTSASGAISRCLFTANTATGSTSVAAGGAIMNRGTMHILNSTFHGNSAHTGGAISSTGNSPSTFVTCCTLTGNSATGNAGGVGALTGTLRVYNSIISGNTAPSSANVGSVWPNGPESCLIDVAPSTIFTTGQLADNGGPTKTVALKPGSPAINAGTVGDPYDRGPNSALLTTDQRGNPRSLGTKLDIGAYEAPLAATLAATSVNGVTATTATIVGNVTSDGYGVISKRGIVYSISSQNPNPVIGGANVTRVDSEGTTGTFTVNLTNLTALTTYAVATYATNEMGTTYSPVVTFGTTEVPSLMVTTTADTTNANDGQTSLREAFTLANSSGSASMVTFSPSLAGQTVTLSNGWFGSGDPSALCSSGQVTIEGPDTSPGITVAMASGANKRHLYVFAGAELTVRNLTFTGGRSTDYGGSIWSQGSLTVRGCTFTSNSSNEGGAIQCWGDSPLMVIENSTFSGNSSTGIAGAIDSGASSMTMRHVTITNNSAAGGDALVIYKNPLTLINCLVAGNINEGVGSANGGSFSPQSTHNLLGTGGTAGLTHGVNGNVTGVAAASLYLGTLADNGGPTATVALLPGSPALNAGTAIIEIDSDQRGDSRLVGSAPDIGAFEQVPVAAVAPQFTTAPGTYEGKVTIVLGTTSPNSVIYYTVDGSNPSVANGILYQGPFTITASVTVKAVATGKGYLDSGVSSASYVITSRLQAWRALHGLAADGSQDLASLSHDGIANLLKYAFNMAPSAGDLLRANLGILASGGTSGMPAITRDGEGRLRIEFIRMKDEYGPGISYSVETGSDLSDLKPLSLSGATVISIDSKWERVTITDPVITGKRFGRVRVTE